MFRLAASTAVFFYQIQEDASCLIIAYAEVKQLFPNDGGLFGGHRHSETVGVDKAHFEKSSRNRRREVHPAPLSVLEVKVYWWEAAKRIYLVVRIRHQVHGSFYAS